MFTGNRPSTSIFGIDLTPHALGALIALYEHITFVEGTVWGIDSSISGASSSASSSPAKIDAAFHDDEALADQDASTKALIEFYRANRR